LNVNNQFLLTLDFLPENVDFEADYLGDFFLLPKPDLVEGRISICFDLGLAV
jgi:hypothetical protein